MQIVQRIQWEKHIHQFIQMVLENIKYHQGKRRKKYRVKHASFHTIAT